ncbi:MAG TPA: DUF1501 domain-containing protein [Tepidisphaeraceae bacterium]|jgi:uncharacterized protein (DUF1501 family)|nr:DUF1501 domain-containing protein [Tepidisphaeraceae bacterium]
MFTANDILFSRRLFLNRGVQLLSLAGTLPLFLDRGAHCLASDFATNPAGAGRPDDHVLVVLQLAGGNDGLNTVIPLGSDDYLKARPTLGVKKSAALRLNDNFGLHPSCSGLKHLYDAGDLAIVHAVGYPNANRSHFRATDIWTTAQPERHGTSGWLGRYCDSACAGEDPGHATGAKKTAPVETAIALDVEPPPALQGVNYIPLTFAPANAQGGKGRDRAGQQMAGDLVAKLNGAATPPDMMQSRHAPSAGAAETEFIQRTALNARIYADKIRNISATIENKASYPQTQLGRDFKLIAQLIASNLPTRVYYVKLGGFDTHANQLQNHPRLLEEVSGGIAAFIDDLKQLGHLNRTTLMTFSEFGRRVHENGSGTDHGEAAPMFLAGGAVKAGLHGVFPSLAPEKLNRGDVPFTTDFRRVYATLLNQWMGADDQKIMGGKFDSVELLKAS